jgi:hypothetical protein
MSCNFAGIEILGGEDDYTGFTNQSEVQSIVLLDPFGLSCPSSVTTQLLSVEILSIIFFPMRYHILKILKGFKLPERSIKRFPEPPFAIDTAQVCFQCIWVLTVGPLLIQDLK